MVRLCFITVNLLCGIAILVYGQSTVSDCPTGSDRNHGLDPKLQQSDVVYQNLLLKMERFEEKLQSCMQEVKDIRKMHLYDRVKACPPGFDFLPDADGCFKVIFQAFNWLDAGKACRGLTPGAHLVAITNAAKQGAIAKYLNKEFNKTESSVCLQAELKFNSGKSLWIGAQRQNPTSCRPETPFVWKTLDSVEIPFDYNNWNKDEPNCFDGKEHCAHVASKIDYKWNDSICRLSLCSLCEF